MNGGHTPVEKKGSPLSGSCCAWSLKSTIPALLSQGCSILINDYSHVNVLLPSSSLTSIHTMLIHNVSSFTVFECFLETLFAACETSAWFRETKTQTSTVLAALPEYCVSYTLCSYLCPCRGLIFDSLCVVQRGEQTFCLSEKLLRSSGIKTCFSTCIPHKAAISVSRHWLGKFGQGIMCKWEHDSVVGKNRQIPGASKAASQTRWWKNLRMQEMMEELDLAFICLFQQDMWMPPLWHHCLISPHQCLMTQPVSVALSQHHCVISSWPCKMGWKAAHNGESNEGPLNRSPKGLKNSCSSYKHSSQEMKWP